MFALTSLDVPSKKHPSKKPLPAASSTSPRHGDGPSSPPSFPFASLSPSKFSPKSPRPLPIQLFPQASSSPSKTKSPHQKSSMSPSFAIPSKLVRKSSPSPPRLFPAPSTPEPTVQPPNCLIFGLSEYATGILTSGPPTPHLQGVGIVALTLFDLRRRGIVGRNIIFSPCTSDVISEIELRDRFDSHIATRFHSLDIDFSFYDGRLLESSIPCYQQPIDLMGPGDILFVYLPILTPHQRDLCIDAAVYALERGLNVLFGPPGPTTVVDFARVASAAQSNGRFAAVDMCKMLHEDYLRGCHRAKAKIGEFSYFTSQITKHYPASYSPAEYIQNELREEEGRAPMNVKAEVQSLLLEECMQLSLPHIYFCAQTASKTARPVRLRASLNVDIASDGRYGLTIGSSPDVPAPAAPEISPAIPESVFSLLVSMEWEQLPSKAASGGTPSHASFASAILRAPSSLYSPPIVLPDDKLYYLGRLGEVYVDHQRRGFALWDKDSETFVTDPKFFDFKSQEVASGFGYRSIESFVHFAMSPQQGFEQHPCVYLINGNSVSASAAVFFDAIRRSAAAGGSKVSILSGDRNQPVGIG